MHIWQAILLGIVEGLTEFLPVSSTGHLTITEKLLGLQVDDPGVTAFTAVIQVGAIAAAIIYFGGHRPLRHGVRARGTSAAGRQTNDYRMALYVIIGSIPMAVVGLVAKPLIEGGLRSLWVVANALIACAW